MLGTFILDNIKTKTLQVSQLSATVPRFYHKSIQMRWCCFCSLVCLPWSMAHTGQPTRAPRRMNASFLPITALQKDLSRYFHDKSIGINHPACVLGDAFLGFFFTKPLLCYGSF